MYFVECMLIISIVMSGGFAEMRRKH